MDSKTAGSDNRSNFSNGINIRPSKDVNKSPDLCIVENAIYNDMNDTENVYLSMDDDSSMENLYESVYV